MNKKIIIIGVGILIIVAAIVIYFVLQGSPSGTGSAGTVGSGLPISTSTTMHVAPTGTTITLGTSQGSVVTDNFYNTADYITQDQQTVVMNQTSTYSIVYNVSDSSFIITILAEPLEANRQLAEAAFLKSLKISEQSACKLNVYEAVPASVSDQASGKPFPLSFCGTPSPL